MNHQQFDFLVKNRDKICVYDKHPIAGRDIQCRAPDSQSRYTTPFGDIIK